MIVFDTFPINFVDFNWSIVIIEINPRTSRSSALASKATGFPIALISAKLASGLTLDEIPYWRDGTLDKYTPGGAPDGDYVVLKFARWAFEKFRGVEDSLGTSMKAVGEVMAIGKTFKETFQKAIRGLENGRAGLGFAKDFNKKSADELCEMLKVASSERYFQLYEAIRKGVSLEKLSEITHVKDYFLQQMKELVELEDADGFLPFNDKSSPYDIKSKFHMSKNAFKRAIGHLLKEGLISIEKDGIYKK